MKRMSKHLNPNSTKFNKLEDLSKLIITPKNVVDVLLSIEENEVCMTLIMNLFGAFDGKSACNPYDILTIPKGLYGNIHGKPNKNEFTTTAGLWVFNKYFIEPDKSIFDTFGYLNIEIGKKAYKKIFDSVSEGVVEDRIPVKSSMDFLMKFQEFMKYETVLADGYSETLLCCTKEINKYKAKLLKENKEGIDNADPIVAEEIEKKLIDFAKDYLGDDPALDLYLSGAQGNFENHFKNIFAFRGVIKNPDPYAKKEYNIITSSYMDGVKPEEYVALCNSLAAGPYARGNKTAIGGYWENLFISGFQDIVLDKEGTDCGTTRTIGVTLTDSNVKRWMYNWIKEGSKLVELNSTNKDKYIGKKVKFRFSSLCEGKNHICSKCAGNLWYRLGIVNTGVLTAQLASKLKLVSMKAFHDSTVSTVEMDVMKAFNVKK